MLRPTFLVGFRSDRTAQGREEIGDYHSMEKICDGRRCVPDSIEEIGLLHALLARPDRVVTRRRAAKNSWLLSSRVTSGKRSIHEFRNRCRAISNLAIQVTKSWLPLHALKQAEEAGANPCGGITRGRAQHGLRYQKTAPRYVSPTPVGVPWVQFLPLDLMTCLCTDSRLYSLLRRKSYGVLNHLRQNGQRNFYM